MTKPNKVDVEGALSEETLSSYLLNGTDRRILSKAILDHINSGGDLTVTAQAPVGDDSYTDKVGIPHILVDCVAPKTFQAYLDKGGDINLADSVGNTAAHDLFSQYIDGDISLAKDREKLLDIVIDKADLTIKSGIGLNPIERAYAQISSRYEQNAASNYDGAGVKPALASGNEFFDIVKNASKDDPVLGQFKQLQDKLVAKLGEDKVREFAKNGFEFDGSIYLKETEYLKQQDAKREGRSASVSDLKLEGSIAQIAHGLSELGVKETASALSKPHGSGKESHFIA